MSVFDLNNKTLKLNTSHNQLLNLNPSKLLDTYDKYMYLKLYIDDTNDLNNLKNTYTNCALVHNNKILDPNNLHLDAGFDLLNPSRKVFYGNKSNTVNKLDHNIVCSAQMITDSNKVYNTGYYMYPRSSISKTNLRLANNVGIIDAGYRGHLMGMFDVLHHKDDILQVHKFDRLLQICAPELMPIYVELVDTKDELGDKTIRGDGGFGSTGV